MSTCIDCYGTNSITPCASVGCSSTNYAKCITYSGSDLFCATGAIKTFNSIGLAVNPGAITEYTVSPTGGTGNSFSVKVTRTPGSLAYTVTLVSAGAAYTINDILTVAGASIGGSTPANNLTISVLSLVPLISSANNLDQVIANLNSRICLATPSGLSYSGFSYGCLRVGGNLDSVGTSITTAQQFTEATAAALCSLNTRVISVETPTFTVPGCVTGITSGSSTLGQVLTAYGTKLCSTTTSIDMSGVTNNPCISYSFTTKPSTTVVSDYINWITTNMCGMHTLQNTNISTVTSTAADLKTYISGVSAVPASINTSALSGGSSTSTLSAAAILFTSQIASLNNTVATLAPGSLALTWTTNFGSSAYYGYTFNYTNSSTTLATQLGRVVDTLGRLKLKLNGSDFVATSDADGLNVSLASGVRFACSQLNSCSISALSDVTTSAPAIYHTLFWNGSEWVNKELIFTSTGGTVTATRSNNATDITVNLEATLATPVRYNFTASTVIGATNGNSLAFPTTPGTGYLMGVLHGKMVSLNGNIRLTSSGSFGITPGVPLDIAVAPTAIRPAGIVYLRATVYVRGTSPYIEPSAAFEAMVSLDPSGVLRLIPYPNYSGTPVVYNVAGQNLEIVLGGLSYTILP
jgi:hypothetical protein